jgi:hypothetical protein
MRSKCVLSRLDALVTAKASLALRPDMRAALLEFGIGPAYITRRAMAVPGIVTVVRFFRYA